MRRALPLLLVVLALASVLAACGKSEEPPPPAAAPQPAVPPPPAGTEIEPEEAIDLAQIALGLDDLPDGVTVEFEGSAEAGEPAVSSYRRNFGFGDVKLGSSRIADLENTVTAFGSIEDASGALGMIEAAFSGESAPEYFREIVRQGAGFDPRNLRGQTLLQPELGDDSVIASASFDTPAGPADGIFLFIRVGRLHSGIFLIGPRGKLDLEDSKSLVAALVGRMVAAEEALAGSEPEA